MRGKGLDRCRIIQALVKAWPQLKERASKTERPFLFAIRANGGKIERIV